MNIENIKIKLDPEDYKAIAREVERLMKPLLNGKSKSDDEIFDLKGVCNYLKVSYKWIYERTHLKEIPYIKKGGKLMFRKLAIDKWLDLDNVSAVDTPVNILKAIKR
ncbi:MAG: helix-turn-helix domain-containing protein [Nitrospirae bacterium]|nr:helix-turn-helix domain-containing protein [Nitrospirota bacterium]